MPMLKNVVHEKFAQLVATGQDKTEAYKTLGYSSNGAQQSAVRLLKRQDVTARVNELRQLPVKAVVRRLIGEKQARVDILDRLVRAALTTIDERAALEREAEARTGIVVPGAKTGMILRRKKRLGVGKEGETIEEYVWDEGIVESITAVMKQAAIELGEWEEKTAVTLKEDIAERIIDARRRAGMVSQAADPLGIAAHTASENSNTTILVDASEVIEEGTE